MYYNIFAVIMPLTAMENVNVSMAVLNLSFLKTKF